MRIVKASVFPILLVLPFVGTFVVDHYFSDINSKWYMELKKPFWIPPNWVFHKVWIALLAGMGVASYLVWKSPDGSKWPLLTFFLQLSLNWAWTPLFFGLKSPIAGLIDLAVLLPTVDVCIFQFFQVSPTAGLLMVPYSIWLSYITYINYDLHDLNKNGVINEGG